MKLARSLLLWLALLSPGLVFGQAYVPGPSPYAPSKPITNGQCLVWSSTAGPNLAGAWINSSCGGGGSGTVTSVSVVTANGYSGTVATSTTTPAITLTGPAALPPNGAAGGDLSGTYPNPGVAQINGTALSGLATGILKNTTSTGVPSIAAAGTDFAGLANNNPFTAAQTMTLAPAANTSADGWILQDTTAASVGNQQFSPRLRLTGQGWKTAAGGASQQVDWIFENQPAQNSTNPSTSFVISDQINGGGYTAAMTMSTLGTVIYPSTWEVEAGSFRVLGSTCPNNGIYSSAANSLSFCSAATAAGLVDATQHWRMGGAGAPTISSGACGTGTNGVLTSGNDQAGLITIGSATTATCTVTFSAAFTTIPRAVHVQAANAAAATALTGEFISALSTTAFTITGTLASTTWYYWVQ